MYLYLVFIILILIACVLMILTVLAQSPKGGMAANFGASNQVMGARQTSDFLEKLTWGLAISILVLSLAATMSMPRGKIAASKTGIEKAIEQSAKGDGLTLPNEFGRAPLETDGEQEATRVQNFDWVDEEGAAAEATTPATEQEQEPETTPAE